MTCKNQRTDKKIVNNMVFKKTKKMTVMGMMEGK